MKNLAILIGKLVLFVGRLLGRGSSMPGKLARQIAPDLLEELDYPKDVVMVTGTNGKTSTTHYIAAIMEKAGKRVVHNREGANMPQGIATVVLEKTDFQGKVDAQVCVFEVDEGFLGSLAEAIRPEYILITNLFEDQADRFGSAKQLAKKLTEAIPQGSKLILNGNDPLLVKLGNDRIDCHKIYFGVEAFPDETQVEMEQSNCPVCSQPLEYERRYYDKIGEFRCKCGFETPPIEYLATDVDDVDKSFVVDGYRYHSKYGNKYFVYNMLGAIAYAKQLEIIDSVIDKALADYSIGAGRMEEIQLGGHNTILNLVKNPAGLNQSLEFILAEQRQDPFNLYLAINSRPADGEDPSWLQAVHFEQLIESGLETFICAGEQAEYLKGILLEKGLAEDRLKIILDPKEAIALLSDSHLKPYILSNYTALAAIRSQLI
ncbi:MAG: MurT ligase domain-containing protein [Tissierellia bacterium]|nr:MurT ligase domain-containing protein [Tissierellia bacterium]